MRDWWERSLNALFWRRFCWKLSYLSINKLFLVSFILFRFISMYPTTLGRHSTVGVEGKDLTGLIGLGGGQILYALLSSSEKFPFQTNLNIQYFNHLFTFFYWFRLLGDFPQLLIHNFELIHFLKIQKQHVGAKLHPSTHEHIPYIR